MSRGVCEVCGAGIEWAVWAQSLRPIALDAGEHRDGLIEVVERSTGGTPIVRIVPVADRPLRRLRRAHCHSVR